MKNTNDKIFVNCVNMIVNFTAVSINKTINNCNQLK